MKKLLAILLAVWMLATLVACEIGELKRADGALASILPTATGEDAPSTPTLTPAPATEGPEDVANKLRDSSYLNQYLIIHYQNTSEITPEQIVPYLYMNVGYAEGIGYGEKIAAEKLYEYARISFTMDEPMIDALKASRFYNAEDDTYNLIGEEYSNSIHNTEVQAYDDLGNNEYVLYIKYGAWNSDPTIDGFSNFSYWKARVKYQPDVQIGDYKLFYYSFEKIDAIPETATSTGFSYIE